MAIRNKLVGIFLILLACFMLLSLCSYSVNDNCLFTISTETVVRNICGAFGAYVSDICLQTFGLFSFLLTIVLFIWGTKYITGDIFAIKHKIVSLVSFVFLGTVLFTILSSRDFVASLMEKCNIGYLAGGSVGYISTKFLFVTLIQNTILKMIGILILSVVWLVIAKKVLFIDFSIIKKNTPKIIHKTATKLGILDRNKAEEKDIEPEYQEYGYVNDNQSEEFVEDTYQSNNDPGYVFKGLSESTIEKKEAMFSPSSIMGGGGVYMLPPTDLLEDHFVAHNKQEDDKLLELSAALSQVLEEFGVSGEIINVKRGPVVTMFEFRPAPGIKTSRVISLSDDIARSMSAISARISLIPGQNAIGIELPNKIRHTVYLKELLTSETFVNLKTGIPLILGKDISGNPIVADLTRMPHLLVAGTTGSGKSVSINDMILSILFKFSPEECKLIMVDPKMLELSVYDDVPHLLTPVVTDPKKAVFALKWAVGEMESRYRQMSKLGVRNIDGFNKKLKESKEKGDLLVRKVQTGFDQDTGSPIFETQQLEFETMPYIVIVVDEMADLMLVAGKDIEAAVQRLAQMARAAGIHLIMATQRPSVDVITGTIKANFPTRISFQVTSKIDSRTILGEQGAEQLLGQGDMLYMAGGGRISRIHGPFVKDSEVERVVNYVKGQGEPSYVDIIADDGFSIEPGEAGGDDMYTRALEIVQNDRKVSISYLQRKLQIGYNRAARIVDEMEQKGVVSPPNHTGKREVLI